MKIVYYLPDIGNPFWRQVAAGAERVARAGGHLVETVGSNHDAAAQAAQLRGWAAKRPDAVLLSPIDITGAAVVCRGILQARVPVVAVDQSLGTDVSASVISGNLRGARLAAIFLAERVGAGRVVHIQAESQMQNVVMRRTSFLNESQRRGLRIVKTLQADSGREKAHQAFKAFLSESPAFEAVFAENDAMALGAVDAMRDRSLVPWPVVVGYDGVPEALEAIRQGRMHATVAQEPELLGEKAVELLVAITAHKKVDEVTTLIANLVTGESLK
jgi:ribose transport system substrate-binding protein